MRRKAAAAMLIFAVILVAGCAAGEAAPATGISSPEYRTPIELEVQGSAKTAKLALRMPEEALLHELERAGIEYDRRSDSQLYSCGDIYMLSRLRMESGEYYLGLSAFYSNKATPEGLEIGDDVQRMIELYGECDSVSRNDYYEIEYYRYDYDGYYLEVIVDYHDGSEKVSLWRVNAILDTAEWADARCDEAAGSVEIEFADGRALRYDFGMTAEGMKSALEELGLEYSPDMYIEIDGPSVEYGFILAGFQSETGGLSELWIANEAVQFTGGLHVGASAGQVLAVYGEMEKEYLVDGEYRYTVQIGELELIFEISEATDIISSIRLKRLQ